MNKKNKMLSIGEISKYTGASIKSLRYYERIKILEPAFVDPESKYRYYSFEQIYLVEIIMLCVELDIPLKELNRFVEEHKTVKYFSLLQYGKKLAEEKIQKLQKELEFINNVEQRIITSEKYREHQKIYSREISEKYFYATPYYGQSFDDVDPYEETKAYLDLENEMEDDYVRLPEYGFMCEYSPSKINRYIFIELPKHKAKSNIKAIPGGTVKTIPSGMYYCTQSRESQIEKSRQIFEEYLKDRDSFLVIETEIFARKYEIDKPLSELRIIAL